LADATAVMVFRFLVRWVTRELGGAYRASGSRVTAARFGLQLLSALVLTNGTLDDVLLNVLASGCCGFALAACRLRGVRVLLRRNLARTAADDARRPAATPLRTCG
jgi:hypothetical protein